MIVAADEGLTIRHGVTGTNSQGAATAYSEPSGVITAAAGVAAPTNSTLPSVPTPVRVGQSVTYTPGVWTGSPTIAIQWRLNGTSIAGATSASYTPTSSDEADTLTVRETASNPGGSLAVTSAGVVVAAAVTAAPPYIRISVYIQELANALAPECDATQAILDYAYCHADPDIMLKGQDVGGVWVSLNGGASWNTVQGNGLVTPFTLSVHIDRTDPRIMYTLSGHRYGPDDDNGIYRSIDGGINWSRVYAHLFPMGEARTGQRRIAQAPSNNSRMYCVIDSANGFNNRTSNDSTSPALLTSSNRGVSWTRVRSLPAGTFGQYMYGCRVDPNNANILYVWGSRGLQRFNDAPNSAGSVTLVGGGLPSGLIWGDFYISPNGTTLIVGRSGDGVYKSTDGGASWTRIYAWSSMTHCAVNDAFPNYIYLWVRGGTAQLRYSTNGSTFQEATVRNFAGQSKRVGGNEPYVIPNAKRAGGAWAHSSAHGYRVANPSQPGVWGGGDAGYCGVHHKNYAAPHMFTSDPLKFMIGCMDIGAIRTFDGGRTFQHAPPYGGQKSCNGLAIHQNETTVLGSFSQETNGTLWRSTNFGSSWTQVRSDSAKGRQWVGFGRGTADANYAWQKNERSTDAGATWGLIPNFPANCFIVGVSRSTISGAGGTISVLYAADIDNNGTKRRVYRSIDRGDTWQQVADFSNTLNVTGGDFRIMFRVHPTSPYVFFTKGPLVSNRSHVRRTNTSTGVTTVLDIFNGQTPPVSTLYIDNFCVDPNNVNVMYARTKNNGTPYFLFRSEDAGATWQNISVGFPTVAEGRGMEVHPSGVLMVACSQGMWCRNPPYSAPANGPFERIRTAYPNRPKYHYGEAYL